MWGATKLWEIFSTPYQKAKIENRLPREAIDNVESILHVSSVKPDRVNENVLDPACLDKHEKLQCQTRLDL